MKQLTAFEMESISGGTFDLSNAVNALAQTAGGALIGGTLFALTGTILGGRYAGSNGGILGFGIIGNAVGFIWGVLAGSVGGGIVGGLMGFDKMSEFADQWMDGLTNGTMNLWS
ncbi:hypothetical protein [Klebsiella sp. KG9]|uniref:hypothetical protein n=1 Tax=Klebsiella sp. KG9 TaxID=2044270 RepID=UPI000BF5CDA4|nr:hypothetical protein [Klebsiella sp. KG9]PEX87148.1 hypothetical protein CRI71_12800 [Klebsiella sp. KG9]